MIQISGVDHCVHHAVRSEKWRDSLHSFLSHDHLRCNDNDGDDNDDEADDNDDGNYSSDDGNDKRRVESDSLHSFLSHDHLRCNDNDGDDSDDDDEHIPAARVSTERNLIRCKHAKVPFCLYLNGRE